MKPDMRGKVVLVTGATGGIGLVTAEALAGMGATVVIVGRNAAKTEEVVTQLRSKTMNANIDSILADLSVMSQVHQAAEAFKQKYDRLDVLLNNAGAMFTDRRVTSDGYEMTFALDHLNYFYLTQQLQDLLLRSAPARIVNVSSDAHKGGHINFDDLMGEQKFSGFGAYAQAKLANVLFTYELARRLEDSGVTANALHPGFVATGFGRNNGGWIGRLMPLIQVVALSPEKGAATSTYLASSPEVQDVTGKYFAKQAQARSNDESYDVGVQRRLWDVSEALIAQAEAVPVV
ncbi:MAG: SDR family oxidoreductase [Anaerolineales bacterium]|nr:SDR family oxidoreductase [Anaerolineales bacterium]